MDYYAELEKKHLGSPEEKTGIYADYKEPKTISMTPLLKNNVCDASIDQVEEELNENSEEEEI